MEYHSTKNLTFNASIGGTFTYEVLSGSTSVLRNDHTSSCRIPTLNICLATELWRARLPTYLIHIYWLLERINFAVYFFDFGRRNLVLLLLTLPIAGSCSGKGEIESCLFFNRSSNTQTLLLGGSFLFSPGKKPHLVFIRKVDPCSRCFLASVYLAMSLVCTSFLCAWG